MVREVRGLGVFASAHGGGLSIAERYAQVRARTEALAAPLDPEDQQLQSMPSASPTKWHRAHTTWFFEAFVLGPRGVPPVDARHGFLFNSYYEAMGPRHLRPARGLLSRPSAAEISAYRAEVDVRMARLLADADEPTAALTTLGLHHEEQHQELILTDILHAFGASPLRPAYRRRAPAQEPGGDAPGATPALGFDRHEGGLLEVGAGPGGFAFDAEGPRHKVWVDPFELARRPIVVGEVRAFVEAGGYHTPSLWLSEGLEWVRRGGREAPESLRFVDGVALGFTVDGEVPLADDVVASHLSYYEADALARFLGGRLPTEHEWEVAAGAAPVEGNLLDPAGLRPARVGARSSPYGDVWVWTTSAFGPYPGFRPAAGAVGEYNGKFMVGQQVLRGGSCFTPRGHVRASYRNFWPPDTTFQMTGARVAR
jgi:ergothioneine biosynthesis protein EgtB